jgi:hypothetical protein
MKGLVHCCSIKPVTPRVMAKKKLYWQQAGKLEDGLLFH